MIIETNKQIDLAELGEQLRLWFLQRDWDVRIYVGPRYYTIMARNANGLRRTFAACRALIVNCYYENGATKVDIRQGSWAENIASNALWLAATGGTILTVSVWSLAVQRQFRNYAQQVLDRF